ncbi:hypothetical protein Tsubulata_024945 [Turnera subulata]|uniref:Phytosulfokine n=1 Tax=Turnera subulata TaxID=218843 RepID=A0A9Q0G9M0_9ROSI|nr:hypothetical protein Tsubulata_037315 [Turnera subulata]KAJ4844416.1 hypothetical protein Tsubulata_024945 [Turnera subulata]
MAKLATLCIIALFLSFVLAYAARPLPSFHGDSLELEDEGAEASCDGVGEEECLTRRTLVAHVDYIYTQEHKHK